MERSVGWLLCCCALLIAGPAWGAAPTKPDRYRGAEELAGRIDKHLEASWKAGKVVPARPADDTEFLRRVYLDLAGCIPSVTEVRTFLADRRPDRRARLVEALLDNPRYATHFTEVWRALLLPEANSDLRAILQVSQFGRWLRNWLSSDKGYDDMVRRLLTAPLAGRARGLGLSQAASEEETAAPFYAAKQYKPEEVASAASQLFLGINLGCAQCHNHPYADWKREQFWSFAAFFSSIRRRMPGEITARAEQVDEHELTIPGLGKKVKARYLDGTQPEIQPGSSTREALARWMTAKDNPWFARAAVNRMWAHFFGTGLIEPLDAMVGTENKASHPQLLDELARAFGEHDYDLKWLIRAITASKAYQLSSARSHPSQDEPRLFARAALRGLTAETLYDSLAMATGYKEGGRGSGTARSEFLTKFANAFERPTQAETSILQALSLMNGQLITTATDLQTSETLAAVADAPFLDTSAKIETLFLATLSRKPTSKERLRLTAYVEKGSLRGGSASSTVKRRRKSEALADIFWALLNSSEFALNH